MEMNLQIGTELNGVNSEIRKENDVLENLQIKNRRFGYERDYLKKKYDELEEERKKLDA